MDAPVPEFSDQLLGYLAAAKLSPRQVTVLRLSMHLPEAEIPAAAELTPTEVAHALGQAEAKLSRVLDDLRGPARRFQRDVVFCAADRRTDDARAPDVCGVTPDWEPDRIGHAPMVSAADLPQSLGAAVRHWAREYGAGAP